MPTWPEAALSSHSRALTKQRSGVRPSLLLEDSAHMTKALRFGFFAGEGGFFVCVFVLVVGVRWSWAKGGEGQEARRGWRRFWSRKR